MYSVSIFSDVLCTYADEFISYAKQAGNLGRQHTANLRLTYIPMFREVS
jgi:hypothetical protein